MAIDSGSRSRRRAWCFVAAAMLLASSAAAETWQPITWFDGEFQQTLWVRPNERIQFLDPVAPEAPQRVAFVPAGARLIAGAGTVRIWSVPDNASGAVPRAAASPDGLQSIYSASPVGAAPRMATVGRIWIQARDQVTAADIRRWHEDYGVQLEQVVPVTPPAYVVRAPADTPILELVSRINRGSDRFRARPDWWREVYSR